MAFQTQSCSDRKTADPTLKICPTCTWRAGNKAKCRKEIINYPGNKGSMRRHPSPTPARSNFSTWNRDIRNRVTSPSLQPQKPPSMATEPEGNASIAGLHPQSLAVLSPQAEPPSLPSVRPHGLLTRVVSVYLSSSTSTQHPECALQGWELNRVTMPLPCSFPAAGPLSLRTGHCVSCDFEAPNSSDQQPAL